jgi:hypothetical protein
MAAIVLKPAAATSIFFERSLTMTKCYIYALDSKTGILAAALSCPDNATAVQVFQIAGNCLERYGTSLRFDYGIAHVGADALIEYKIPARNSWQFLWSRKNWYEEQLHKKIRFDLCDFEIAEAQTKRAIFKTRYFKTHHFDENILFMSFANSELEELAQQRQSGTIKTSTQSTAQEISLADYRHQIQAASGKGISQTAMDMYQESIEWADDPADVKITNTVDIEQAVFSGAFRAMARFQEPIEETDIERVHRLRLECWAWKEIIKQVYPDTKGIDIDSEVERVKKQHRRAYPEWYEK